MKLFEGPTLAMMVLATCVLLATVRLVKGPKLADRVLATDLIGVLFLAMTLVLAHLSGEVAYLDVATVLALVAFLSTVVFARFLESAPRGTKKKANK